MIITIDGPTASGKSTVAQALAGKLGCYYLNTGLLYRACAYLLMRECKYDMACFDDPQEKDLQQVLDPKRLVYTYDARLGAKVLFDECDITQHLKTPEISKGASVLGVHPMVRDYLLSFQQQLGQENSLVAEGRDTGSIVFPNADVKFYIFADITTRAQRWLDDLTRKNKPVSFDEVVAMIAERDKRDKERDTAPLVVPEGAFVIDNTHLTFEQTVEALFEHIKNKFA